MKRNDGFTLIELMIVVEIIAILAAIGFPNYLRTRIQANEASAVGNLRSILEAQTMWNTQNYSYSGDLSDLTDAVPPFLDGDWGGVKGGYLFRLAGGGESFLAYAEPVNYGVTGWHGFLIDPSATFHYELNGPASLESPVLGK
jgi:prepilin-type N-terminal cleavage/methylation domain-containing protein